MAGTFLMTSLFECKMQIVQAWVDVSSIFGL